MAVIYSIIRLPKSDVDEMTLAVANRLLKAARHTLIQGHEDGKTVVMEKEKEILDLE